MLPAAAVLPQGSSEDRSGAPVILVLGDSLSAAYGMALDKGWVRLLQRRLEESGAPHRVVNASVSGDTTAGGASRLPALLEEWQPQILILELGANDGLRGFAPSQIADRLSAMIERARSAGADVLLLGVRLPPNYGRAYTDRFQGLYRKVAERTGAALVPRLLAGVADEPVLMQGDGLHPEAAAQPRLLENVWPALTALLERPG